MLCLQELAAWLKAVLGESCRYLAEAHRLASEVHSINTEGGTTYHHERRLMLPATFNGCSKKRWVSGGLYLPRCISPLDTPDERKLVEAIINELHANLGASLQLQPDLNREVRESPGALNPGKVVIVGEAMPRGPARP